MPVSQRGHEWEKQRVEFLSTHPCRRYILKKSLEPALKRDFAAADNVWVGMGLFQDRGQLSRVMHQLLLGENPIVLGPRRMTESPVSSISALHFDKIFIFVPRGKLFP